MFVQALKPSQVSHGILINSDSPLNEASATATTISIAIITLLFVGIIMLFRIQFIQQHYVTFSFRYFIAKTPTRNITHSVIDYHYSETFLKHHRYRFLHGEIHCMLVS